MVVGVLMIALRQIWTMRMGMRGVVVSDYDQDLVANLQTIVAPTPSCPPRHRRDRHRLAVTRVNPETRKKWRTREDSNLWPLPSEGSALSS